MKELPVIDQVFNLAAEVGADPDRVLREKLQAATDRAAAREYELRMQRTFAQCLGFCGSDDASHVVVEPSLAMEARAWLRRRFKVNDAVELSDFGLCLEVIPRANRRVPAPRRRVSFDKPRQFELSL